MKVLIIEDEQATADRLIKLLTEIEPEIEILNTLDSVSSSIDWYKKNPNPDLVFQDIQLADGSAFEIFKEVEIKVPVIFITAFDQYALQAFRVNSIDYLLKPVKKEELIEALAKYSEFHKSKRQVDFDYTELAKILNKESFQKRFVVRYGQKIKAIDVDDIAYFFTSEGNIFFKTFENLQYPLDVSLDNLEPILDPLKFYRINRQFIISYKSIREMYTYSKSRVKIILHPPCEQDTIASTDRSGSFKKWLAGQSE
ncbi:MAG: response regulator transcription factor [Bacteroidales bacterium]|nr:response regulator transcription factor [Bacteroidales bacterium]